jgi:ParB family chromosome partitioning protein
MMEIVQMTTENKKKTAKAVLGNAAKPRSSGPGMTNMGLATPKTPVAAANGGGPLNLDMDLIDEDPRQPRTNDNPGFANESLSELAASIRLRGVKTPISVRDNPNAPGRFLINHGARRFRGSKRADKTTIPGFVDNDYNEADQVVENLQRNELTAREIADYIGRELAKGIKKGEIARAISKSPAFVKQHVTLLDLPDPIAEAFNTGRAKDVTVINELVTAFKSKQQEVNDWLGDENQEITRGSVKLLREFLDDKRKHEQGGEDEEGGEEGENGASQDGQRARKKVVKPDDPERLKKAIIQVQHNERRANLILNRRPQAEGFAWLKYEDDGHEFEVDLAHVRLVAVLEG